MLVLKSRDRIDENRPLAFGVIFPPQKFRRRIAV